MEENQDNNKVTDTSLEIEKMKKELHEMKESNDTQIQDIDKQLNHLNHKRKKDKEKVDELQEEIGKDHHEKQSAVVRSESQKPITTTSTLEDNKPDTKDSKDSTNKDKKGKNKKPEGEKIAKESFPPFWKHSISASLILVFNNKQ